MALDQTYCKDRDGKNSRRKTFTITPMPTLRLENHNRNNDTASTENIQRYDQSLFQESVITAFSVGASSLEHLCPKESFMRNGKGIAGAYPVDESKAGVFGCIGMFSEITEKLLLEAEDVLNGQKNNSPDIFEMSNLFEATRIDDTPKRTRLEELKLNEQALDEEVRLLMERNRSFIMKQKATMKEKEVQIQKVDEATREFEMKTAKLSSKKLPNLVASVKEARDREKQDRAYVLVLSGITTEFIKTTNEFVCSDAEFCRQYNSGTEDCYK